MSGKQCLKRQDIHRALLEKGFNISYSSVCKYIQRRKMEKARKPKDVFVKQYYEPGEECEFDWGEVKLRIDGKPVTFTMAVFALCHSEGRWAYLFRHRFCNARAGWEKGHVERSVDYVRGRAFTTRVDFASISDAQIWLSRICDNINNETGSIATGDKREALRRDMDALLHFPGDFGCFDLLQCTVDKQSTISVKNCHYSVPDHLSFDQIKVALETNDTAPLMFTDSQKTDAFLEIEMGCGDVLSQLDGIMGATNKTNDERRYLS